MKNILKIGILVLMSLTVMIACDPMESSDYELGPIPTTDQLTFTQGGSPNIVEFANSSSIKGVATWDFGNGSKGKGDVVSSEYAFAGNYTVTMTLYTSGGSASVSKEITITADDMSLLNTPFYNALTGGASNLAGKTWVYDQYHDGHFGIAPADATSPSWWTCLAEEKTGSSMYTQEFTFTQVGTKLAWKNNGYIYTNEAGKNALGGESISNPGGVGDFDVKIDVKPSYTFTLNETAKTITLNDGAFFGFYTGTSTYEIYSLTEDEMYLKNISAVEPGNSWWFRFIPIEKNVKPVVIIPLKVVPLTEDFEGTTASTMFTGESMGISTSASWSNPAPFGLNTSNKVYLYQKSTEFYSNIFFVANGYKFDLTEQNKIKLKVFIPSYNNYDDTFAVAGDWISNNKLQPQLAVKLQNSSKGGNAWETQTEIVKANLQKDKWLELEFDFSNIKDRQDYDKIVIQFGAEGHAGPGIFFFDDFSFSK